MADEARAMLDALMGGDRNAPLPSGTATKKSQSNEGQVVLPSKRKKSCYDADIDPLYCAWNGIDVYELFVNTKSDIGGNPKVVSDAAKEEFASLPIHEQERLGFHYLLFQKLQDLVRMCDRTVARNKEKLIQEKRGKGQANVDYVKTVDERALYDVVKTQLDLDAIVEEINQKEKELNKVMKQEAELRAKYEEEKRKQEATKNEGGDDTKEQAKETDAKDESREEDGGDAIKESANGVPKEEEKESAPKEAEATKADDQTTNDDNAPTESSDDKQDATKQQEEASPLEQEMQALVLKRQRLLFDLARSMHQHAPIQQALDSQMEQLNYVKSDITSDKTVCEVSGNFMSARDADERIAAHYAGKQYVGWKLVRDKLKSMIQQYGRYGPPPGEAGRRGSAGGRGDSRYGRNDGRGGRPRYGGRNDGRWERGGGGYGNRDYGDDRYNRGGYGGGRDDYYRHGGGGGGGRGRDRGHWRR